MQHKEVKFLTTDEVEGKVEAVFSVFNEVDSDGDVVLPNSIKSAYGDKGVAMVWAHDWKNVIGRGEIIQDDQKAVFKGQFIMDTQAGREAFETVKAMGDLQQWSFGYEVVDYEVGMFKKDMKEIEVRYLKDLKVYECSPVLVGANQNTYTMAVKEDDMNDDKKGLRFNDEVDKVLNSLSALLKRAKELTSLRIKKEKLLSEKSAEAISDLRDQIQEVYQDLDTLLLVASPQVENNEDQEEVEEDAIDDTTLLLETERILVETQDPDLIVGE